MIGISLPFEKVKGIFTITFKIIRMSIVIRKVNSIMAPSVNEQYIVDEKGNPTAVILPIKEYKKMLSILEEVEDHTRNQDSLPIGGIQEIGQKGAGGYQSRENQILEGSLG